MEIFSFGLGVPSSETSADVLGGKGAGLVYLDSIGVKVPPGFILPCNLCGEYLKAPKTTMKSVAKAIKPWLKRLEAKFGYMPLLSVRSGARISMPGMMDTILNVGLDESTADGWVKRLGKECVVDSRRRLIEMYGSVVKGLDRSKFEGKNAAGARDLYLELTGEPKFPGAEEQLLTSIEAVFKSWNNERAKIYRKMHSIPEDWGTAVTVMAMVFGNLNDKSATGVLFTRNPDSGENKVVGEFLPNAQGEDVVAGIRTPLPLPKMSEWNQKVANELLETVAKLEKNKKDVQDVEFTIQDGELYILQTRNAKRSSRAAVRIAVEMVEEGLLTEAEAFERVSFKDYVLAQSDVIDPSFKGEPMGTGIPACSGVVTGVVVKTAAEAIASKKPCILVTHETCPDDIGGMAAAKGVLTMTGGATSHAAVVARGMNKPCVVGLGMHLDQFPDDMPISIDGATGRVWAGSVPVISGAKDEHVAKLNKLLATKAGTVSGIIAEENSSYLDLSDFHERKEEAMVRILKSIEAFGKVIVDTRLPSDIASKKFATMFKDEDSELKFVNHIATQLEMVGKLKNVTFICDAIPQTKSLQSIATVKTVEELVKCGPEYIVDGLPTDEQWVKKLVDWKTKAEGGGAVFIGVVGPGKSYLSLPQIAQALLRA